MTPAELREVLANSPLDPGPMAPDMTGRDCGYMLRAGRPVYDVPVACAVCGSGGA